MIRKHQKSIAVLAVFMFLSLLQISSLPINAENSPNQAGIAADNAEEAPGVTEVEGEAVPQAKKKSILPKILIGLGVVAVAAVLYFVVFKKKAEPEIEYDITGAWALNYTLQGDTAKSTTITFSGDKTSGTFSGLGYTGTYTVDGKNVEFIFPSSTRYSGSFTDTQNMSGTILNYQGIPGTWTATKILQ